MAKGFDELIEFLLAEIALCGAQGKSRTDDFLLVARTLQESSIRRIALDQSE